MNKTLIYSGLACSLLLGAVAAPAQSLTFNTLAGYAGQAGTDGAGNNARFNDPCGVAADIAGNVYVADTANHTIRKVTPAGVVSTLAGLAGVSGTADGTGATARFNQPQAIAVDANGTVYVADTANHAIRKVTSGGVVTTLAATPGTAGASDGTGAGAQFYEPQGISVDNAGNVYVADTWNHTIRKVTAAGVVTTLAGSVGLSGCADGTNSAARFNWPAGMAADNAGNLYVADFFNHTVRKLAPAGTNWVTSTLAGLAGVWGSVDATNSAARLFNPQGVAVDSLDNVYVAESGNQAIRKVTPAGLVSTLAGSFWASGSADGAGNMALFRAPRGIAVSGSTVYVADTGNGTIRIVTAGGAVSTLAGSPSAGTIDGAGGNARFYWPAGAAADTAGNVYLADSENSTIRKITAAGAVSTLAGAAGTNGSTDGTGSGARFYAPQGVAVDSVGNTYVADMANHTIRKITPGGAVTTLAGLAGTSGTANGTGGNARFYAPEGVAVDTGGTVYVADTWNHTIRKVTAVGAVTTLAGLAGSSGTADGTGGSARFYQPQALALDGLGNVFVADTANNTIRKITSGGAVTTLAGSPGNYGSADGTGSGALFYGPAGIALDGSGNLYVADYFNQTIRKVTSAGVVTTVAGMVATCGSADGLGTSAQFCYPAGLAISPTGSFYVADSANNTLRLAVLVTNGAPAIIVQPQSQSVDENSSVTFSVTASGTATLSYQWRFNTQSIGGATASTYTRGNVQTNDAGSYSVIVSNTKGSATSADAQLTVNGPPFITGQPQDEAVAIGQSAGFTVAATGAQPLSYQWRYNGSPIPGATDPAFTLSAVQGADGGSYSVLVTNTFGAAASVDAVLFVVVLPQAWGDDSWGQADVPLAAGTAIAVAAGAWHNLALRTDGTVVGWGADYAGQCDAPATLTNALAIAAGSYHSLAIRATGIVTAWGNDDYGQTEVPANLMQVIGISAGTWHSVALRADGTVAAWGDNSYLQCNVPTGQGGVVAVAAGGNHSLALKADGTVVGWGENTDAGGNYAGQATPPAGLSNVVSLAAGNYHSLAVLANGSVVAWGDDSDGQCDVPATLTNAVAVAGGGMHSLALLADGSVVAWGADWNGQCEVPAALSDVVGIGAGEEHSVALPAGNLPAALLLSPARQQGHFTALVQTLSRRTYAFDYEASLATANWTALSTNAGNGALRLLSDPSATNSQRWYRMRQW